MSQSSYSKSPTRSGDIGGELDGETRNLGRRLEWRDPDETWWVE